MPRPNSPILIASCMLVGLFAMQSAQADVPVLYTYRTLSVERAQQAASSALLHCRKQGYSVAVAVVDRGGNLQALLRDRFAGPHTPETARRKAWTANSFRQSTADLAQWLKNGNLPQQVQHNPGALLVGGGLKIEAQGELLGAIGVAGAPPGRSEAESIDAACAAAGLASIQSDLDFAE